ncbi:hypothetical protein HOD20_01820 [archaeon]|jgi:hypothetical protein|nr:hypothetical protein [archaeon]MBT4351243.1 hypothetical protein [archaeon]MBT4648129.1 hypothetical protein [archaeon]MBT6822453.1 hypothetical protein [archaeon]MBT7392097.1 hypothetical protein [archaeon]
MLKRRKVIVKKKIDYEALLKKYMRFLLVFTISLFIVSRFINPKLAIFLFVTTAFNAMLQKFILKTGVPADFELSTFATIIATMGFGLKMGLLVAILSKFIAMVATAYMIADHFFMMFTYIMAAILTSIFISISPGIDPLTLGLTIVIMNNALMFFMSAKIMRLDITSNLSYTLTNFFFNLVVFSVFIRGIHGLIIG